uniref:Uncharacterized protein n=1 Tax=Arundo donax TaxID=35708 RepID=A0A0A8Z9R3_ARUDO
MGNKGLCNKDYGIKRKWRFGECCCPLGQGKAVSKNGEWPHHSPLFLRNYHLATSNF